MTLTPDARAALARAGFSRRRFLQRSGALVVGFSAAGLADRLALAPAFAQGARAASGSLDSWIAVAADGLVTAYTGKCELGQGIETAQVQLIAEELSIPAARVRLIMCDTSATPDQGTTSGSQSHPTNFNHANLALAAATAREALAQLAAARLGVAAGELTIADGIVHATSDPSRRIAYGELIGGKTFTVALNPKAARKDPRRWTVLGTSVPRVDMAAMATGELEYVQNVRVPGMLHGAVVRPPEVGATVAGVDEGSVRDMAGLVRVVVKQNFVGVVAEKPWQAVQAASKLKVTWTPGVGLPPQATYYDYLRKQPSRDSLVVDSRDVDAQLARAATVLKATYVHPHQMHGSMGTSCAVADVTAGGATIWSASQAVFALRSASATVLGLPIDKVRVVFTRGSGCYGINGADTVSYDAALLSQAVARPVRVQLTRKDEMAWENYGSAFVIDQRVGLDAAGIIIAWDYEAWSASLGGRPGYDRPGNVVTGLLVGHEPAVFAPRTPAPPPAGFNNGSNTAPSYVTGCVGATCGGTGSIKSERALSHSVRSPFFTGPLRSPNRLQNTFAHECFMDEIAAQLKVDPLAYRLRHLRDPRLIAVVNAAAKAAGWETRPSPRRPPSPPATSVPAGSRGTEVAGGDGGRASGRGFACVLYEGDNGYCAMVAEVDVDRSTGRIAVTRLVCSQDCGPISSPDGMKNQIEGGALQGMSRALGEAVTWDGKKVTSVDWRTFHSLSLGADVPTIESVLIDRRDVEASGAGETTITLVAAAIGNAVFDATGARLREVPFTPEHVIAALKQSATRRD